MRRKPVSIIRVQPKVERPWELSQEQITILKNSIAKGSSDDELKYCLEVARRYRLDPFKQQIWFIPRWDKNADDGRGGKGRNIWVPQVGIYGMLHIAARDHADYGSLSLPEYGPMIEVEVDGKKIRGPEWARVKVWKKGMNEPTVGEAFFEEYCPKRWDNTLFWRTMGRRMIAKCAKAQGVREAYPDLGGLTIPEEMERINEDYTESGREIVVAGGGSKEAAQEVGKRRVEELKAKIEARKQEKVYSEGGEVFVKEPKGVIELDWSVDESFPVVRGEIASLLETLKLNLHMNWDRHDNWWHCESRDAEKLRAICEQFHYELKEILPAKFPARGGSPEPLRKAANAFPASSEPGKSPTGEQAHPLNPPVGGSEVATASKTTNAEGQKLAGERSKPEGKEITKPERKRPKTLPNALIPYVVKAVKWMPSGKGLEVTLGTGAKLYCFDNRKMGENGEKLLDLLVTAVNQECIFTTAKNKTKEGREFTNITGMLKMGVREWDESGVPILRRDPLTNLFEGREPGDEF